MHSVNTYKKILFGCSIALLFASCRADQTTFEPYGDGQEKLNQLLQTVPAPKETLTFNGADLLNDQSLVLSNGVRIILQDNDHLFALPDGTAQPVSTIGKVEIVVESSLTVGDWIGRNLPSSDVSGIVLNHIGAIKITVLCDGKPVQIQPGRNIKVYIPSEENATGYEVSYTTDDQDFWGLGTSNSVFNATWNGATQGVTLEGYELLVKKMDWTTAIQPLSPNGWTAFSVTMPLQFDDKNTKVFIVLNDGQLAVEMKPVGNGGKFIADAIPNNTTVRVVSVSATGSQYWLGDVVTNVANDNSSIEINPELMTAQSITDFLKSL